MVQFIHTNVADTYDGHPVNFGQTFFNTVSAQMAFPVGMPDNASTLLAGFDLEMWGLPTSRPSYDPTNKSFIYLRFQRGIMHYDAGCNCTHGLLLADYLKSVLLNLNVPGDLGVEARSSPFLAQWAPARSFWLARPAELSATDLTGAFVTVNGTVPPAAAQPGVAPQPSPTPTPSTGTLVATPPSAPSGYDVSFPQCNISLPESPVFAMVGVNDGRPYELNPCFTGEARWALAASSARQSKLSLYLNTSNPGSDDGHWPYPEP